MPLDTEGAQLCFLLKGSPLLQLDFGLIPAFQSPGCGPPGRWAPGEPAHVCAPLPPTLNQSDSLL